MRPGLQSPVNAATVEGVGTEAAVAVATEAATVTGSRVRRTRQLTRPPRLQILQGGIVLSLSGQSPSLRLRPARRLRLMERILAKVLPGQMAAGAGGVVVDAGADGGRVSGMNPRRRQVLNRRQTLLLARLRMTRLCRWMRLLRLLSRTPLRLP